MPDLVIDPWRSLIVRRREQLDLSQRELALAAGVAEKTVYNLEAGVSPRPGTLRKVLTALGLSTELEVAQQQVRESGPRVDTVFADTGVLIGLAKDDELRNFIEQVTQMLDLMPHHKRREVMDDILNDVLRILRRSQPYSVRELDSARRKPWAGLDPEELKRLNELLAQTAAKQENFDSRRELIALIQKHEGLVADDHDLAAHDEDHTIESEQGHDEHP